MSLQRIPLSWYLLGGLLAVCLYFYSLDSQHIPKNGDEYVYQHITRLTADSGHWLPLQSQLDNMRNTKPPLLFWQGMVATGWGKQLTLWKLRYPSVLYTLLTAFLLVLLGRRLSGNLETGMLAALTWLAFFSTYRYGRPFLTNPPEVFWLMLPFFALLYWPRAFSSRLVSPLLFGLAIGIAFLYKSFALGLPVLLALASWYAVQREWRLGQFLRRDALKLAIALGVAAALFALWFVLDPDPQAVWREFVVGENAGKFDPHGPGYLATLLWGGSSIWSYLLAFLGNAGLLIFPVAALMLAAYRRRALASWEEKLLWLWIAAFLFSFALPSQRSGRYLLDVMPAVALLCALNWQHIARKAFVASLLLIGTLVGGMGFLAYRLQAEMPDAQLYASPFGASSFWASPFWLLVAATLATVLWAIARPHYTRYGTVLSALLALLCLAVLLQPFDGTLGRYSESAIRYASGKEVGVPCNFRAVDEGHRFLLPGARITGYSEDQNLSSEQLMTRYPLFAARVPLNEPPACAGCKLIGQRLDIRSRQSSDELRAMLLEGKVFQYLFVREVLWESPPGQLKPYRQTPAQLCR